MTDLAPTEIMALAGILEELDYYQLLHLAPDASPQEIKQAYHATSRALHPDGNRHHEPPVRDAIEQIAKRVTEAYCVLNKSLPRKAYDEHRSRGGCVRIQLAEAEAAGSRQVTAERQGHTPQGRQYFNLALADLKRSQFGAAVRNLQTALTFEPNNSFFKDQLASARQKIER